MRKQEEVTMATQDSPSLYERLGGVYSIATVVDDLIDRVMADPRLNANPLVDDAHHKVPPAGFKYLVTEMLRSEEHTSELQSHSDLVCRLLLEKKKDRRRLATDERELRS